MPLNVQPLSPLRRLLMILFMLTVLALSLGFAQWLIAPHQLHTSVHVIFQPPHGLTALPLNDSMLQAIEGTLVESLLKTPDGPRHLHAFYFEDSGDVLPQEYIEALLNRILPDPSYRAVSIHPATLGNQSAMEAERHVGRGPDSAFAIIRLASLQGHIVAFCFSGDGLITDADRQFLQDYCTKQIEIRFDKLSRKG